MASSASTKDIMIPIFNGNKPPLPPSGPQGAPTAGPPVAAGGPPPQGPPPGAGGPPPGAGGPPTGPGAGGPPPELLQKLMMLKQAQGAGPGGPGAGAGGGPKGPKYDIDKVSPETSGYMGADKGPFECGNCVHFQGPNSCQIVAGPVEEDGCCNLFNPSGKETPESEAAEGDDEDGNGPGPEPTEPQ